MLRPGRPCRERALSIRFGRSAPSAVALERAASALRIGFYSEAVRPPLVRTRASVAGSARQHAEVTRVFLRSGAIGNPSRQPTARRIHAE